jgi:hypothetical protein
LNPTRASALVVGAFLLFCGYFSGFFPPFFNPNELSRFQTVVAFVETGSFAIDGELATLGDHEDKAAAGGRLYSNKAPGLSLAAIPVYALLRVFLPRPDSPTAVIFVLLRFLTVSLVCVLALARFARRLSRRPEWFSIAPLVTFAVGFGTPFLYYARSFFGHGWTAALLFLAWDVLLRSESGAPGRVRDFGAVAAGLLAGWAAISEYTMAPVALALAARAAFAPPGPGRARKFLLFAAGAAVPLGLVLAYQAACFGSPFVPSYAREAFPAYAELAGRRFFGFGIPDPKVAFAYFFHPARGILLFSPFFFWAGPGFARWLRSKRDRADGVFALAASAAAFLLLTAYPNWHGGWSFGSRYLLPLLFLTAASLPFALGSSLSRGFFAAAVVFSAGVHVLATLSWPNFPLDFSFPPASASAWFLARGWIAPNLGSAAGLAPALALSVPLAAAAAAVVFALAAARPISPAAPLAAILGALPLAIALLRPPGLSYPARLLRAAIYGDYSGRDAGRAELRTVVGSAATPLERRQAEAAWSSSGPRR